MRNSIFFKKVQLQYVRRPNTWNLLGFFLLFSIIFYMQARSMEKKFQCQMCPVSYGTMNKAAIHALKGHRNESRFRVSCMFPLCLYSSRSWPAFRKHVTRKHGFTNIIALTSLQDDQAVPDYEVDPDLLNDIPQDLTLLATEVSSTTDTLMGKFVLSLETQHHMTRKGLADITGTIEELTQQISLQVQRDVKAALDKERDADIYNVIAESCKLDIQHLSQDRSRHMMYQSKYHYIPAEPIYEGSRSTTLGHYVPLEGLLQLLCRQDQIWACVQRKPEKGKATNANVLRDFADGEYLQEHPLTHEDCIFLQILLYYDDLELQNPLRSNKRHKMAMFYMTLLNIPPVYRSQLQNIFAVAIAPVQNVKKHGFLLVLADFLHTLKRLRTCGIYITRGEKRILVRGDLVAALCDTPAAAALGGFKESCAFAEHFCRSCMACKETYKSHQHEEDFDLRTEKKYDQQCKTLEDPALQGRRPYWSKLYGINQRSCLCAVPGFNVTESLLQDPMHVILEGSLPYVLALFLKDAIYGRRLFTLSQFNAFLMQRSNFPQDRKNVIVPIEPKDIKKEHIKQKASSMLLMAYTIPFFFGQYLEEGDEPYSNLLCLIRITCICFKPITDVTCAGVLSQEIADFLHSFRQIYSVEKVKPKMHFMVHFPRQMQRFGPLRHHSTMRAEAKHQSFKDHRWMNFNNVALSLLKRHQLCLANALSDSRGCISANFLQENRSMSAVRQVKVLDLDISLRDELKEIFHLQDEDVLQEHNSLQWRGRLYDRDSCVLISECLTAGPLFGKIHKLYTQGNMCYVWGVEVETVDFSVPFNAYKILAKDTHKCIDLAALPVNWPLPLHEVQNDMYVVNRYGVLT